MHRDSEPRISCGRSKTWLIFTFARGRNATSAVSRFFAFQTGFALWLVIFGFLLSHFIAKDPANLMPGSFGNKWFDVSRFFIAALVSGLCLEALYVNRVAPSEANTAVWYLSFLFILPYFHHFFGSPKFDFAGAAIMALVLLYTQLRLATRVREWYYRLLMNIMGLPSLAIALETILHACRAITTTPWNLYTGTIAAWELPVYYSLIIVLGATSLACTVHDSKCWRILVTTGLVTLHGALWWNSIVKPF